MWVNTVSHLDGAPVSPDVEQIYRLADALCAADFGIIAILCCRCRTGIDHLGFLLVRGDCLMFGPVLTLSPRLRSTPFTARVEPRVKRYTVYNHMLLPSTFQSLEEDYYHLKTHVQLWDVAAERQVEVCGKDANRLVQLMTPRDLSRLAVGRCAYVPLVDEDAGIINDPIALRLADDRFWLSIADSDVLLWAKGLAYGLRLDVQLDEPDVSPFAVQGPKSEILMARVFGDAVRRIGFFNFRWLTFDGCPLLVARSGWSKQGGFEIYVDNAALGLPLWDTLMDAGRDLEVAPGCPNLIERIEGGLLSYGSDMTRKHNPFECGLEGYCDLDPNVDCMAQDAMQRLRFEEVRRHICGLRIDADSLPACAQRWPVHRNQQPIGAVSSAAWSPSQQCGVAIAMLDTPFWQPQTEVVVHTPDNELPAISCALPFF